MAIMLMGNTGCSNEDLNTTENYLEKGKQGAEVLGSMVPVTQPWAAILVGAIGLAGTVVGAMKANKNGKRANDYRDGIEAAIANGDNKNVADVEVLKEVLDTDTKTHFNETGTSRL